MSIFFAVFIIPNIYLSTLVHKFLSKTLTSVSEINYVDCIDTVLTEPNCFMIFGCFQIAFLLFLLLASISRTGDFSEKTSQLTSKIETPEASGKNQHGSARFLDKSEYDAVYDTAILSKTVINSNMQIKQVECSEEKEDVSENENQKDN